MRWTCLAAMGAAILLTALVAEPTWAATRRAAHGSAEQVYATGLRASAIVRLTRGHGTVVAGARIPSAVSFFATSAPGRATCCAAVTRGRVR